MISLLGVVGLFYILHRLGLSKRLSIGVPVLLFLIFLALDYDPHPFAPKSQGKKHFEEILGAAIFITNLLSICAATLAVFMHRLPKFNAERRKFLRTSTVAACAVPATVFGAAIITRKDFHVKEVDVGFPHLPRDLDGLRLVQISDIHIGTFFSRADVKRVVDAANGLRGDMVFITGDLITDHTDPLDDCLLELKRLRSGTGIWGCMGNHEMYSRCQTYTKRQAARMGIDFLRYERRAVTFGTTSLNLIGVDYQKGGMQLPSVDQMIQPETFNLLLSHTPVIFPAAVEKGVDLTLSGHTHGGQINLELAGMNINLVDLVTPYTKGLYRNGHAAIYVNSGLGTIGVPMRIGAPPEITVIRLCNS